MSDLDERLRTALTGLGADAEQRIRPAGSHTVPPAGRRRRRAVRVATGALVLVLAGGAAATAGRLAGTAGDTAASSTCRPLNAIVTMPIDASDEKRRELAAILAGPEIASVRFESAADAYERFKAQYENPPHEPEMADRWDFTVRCADDFNTLRLRIEALPVTFLVYCTLDTCGGPVTVRPSVSGR